MKLPLTAIPAVCFGLGIAACATARSASHPGTDFAMAPSAAIAGAPACRAEHGPALVSLRFHDDTPTFNPPSWIKRHAIA